MDLRQGRCNAMAHDRPAGAWRGHPVRPRPKRGRWWRSRTPDRSPRTRRLLVVTSTAWRIVKARHVAAAFDAEGARLEGGRWNSPGRLMVYTSQSAALAALEMLVHLGRGSILSAYVLIPCTFDDTRVSRLDRGRLRTNWRSYPAPPELPLIGDEWVKSGMSAVLEVPSAVIETDSNYLLNPQHREFQTIHVMDPQAFEFDFRLLEH